MSKRAQREKEPAKGTKRQRTQELRDSMVTAKASNDEQFTKHLDLRAKTEAQGHYILNIKSKQLTFGLGPAGTGKTYVCTMLACQALAEKQVEKIIVTRPAVEAGGGLGFLPGSIEEKFAPYFAPFKHVFEAYFGAAHTEYLIKRGFIEIAPLEYIRGLTFDNAFVILDEAQNTTPKQMKLFLTRLGEYARVVVNGDTDQQDIEGLSGLQDAVNRLEGMERISVCEFDEDDIVRSGLVRDILKRYRRS